MNFVVGQALDSATMARVRRVFHPEFGQCVAEWRTAAGFRSQAEAALRATHLQLKNVSQQRISLLEKGKTKDPDPELLHDLAVLYRTDYATMLTALIAAKYGAEAASVVNTTLDRENPDHSGVVNAATQARLRELEDRLAAYKIIVRRIRQPLERLLALTVDREQSRTAARAAAGRRRRHRGHD